VPEVVQISYSDVMDHLAVLRDKIGRLREEIADIQELMSSFGVTARMEQMLKSLTDRGLNGCKRSSKSLCNSQTLAAELSRQNIMKEKHRSRLHLVKQKRAS
jgi:hypothetical protein